MDWQVLVGRKVRDLRKGKGLTQEALAHSAGVDTRYIGGIERGEENPSLSVLVRIAEVLGQHPADLLRE